MKLAAELMANKSIPPRILFHPIFGLFISILICSVLSTTTSNLHFPCYSALLFREREREMGVPSFYRWLVNKYPKIVDRAKEDKGEKIDTSSPNPNGIEFDNLYLDMNGIIHPCFHPEDSIIQPTSYQDVFNSIYEYIDRLFSIVRPRKILYMAIDGVAPRAKMNQQRSRRFRSAKDNEIAEAEEQRLRSEFEKEGNPVLPKQESEVSDSCIITPGTEFMFKLSKALQQYICSRMKNDAGWKNVKVILSDANVPGEGEHKIMTFIRNQRNHPSYNPNTRHCLYGLDADLIMLSLATHELHFSILREDLLVQEEQPTSVSSLATSLSLAESSSTIKQRGWFRNVLEANKDASLIKKHYLFVHIWILREYLELDMQIADPPEKFEMDVERIIDDFIFICFFLGNDFIPHMPTLEIQEGAIDLLMAVYKAEFKKMGGYLVDMNRVDDKKMGYIKLKRVERFILSVGTYEEKIFIKRSKWKEGKLERFLRDHADDQDEDEEDDSRTMSLENTQLLNEAQNLVVDYSEMLENTKKLKQKLKDRLRGNGDLFKKPCLLSDKVKLGSPGYKERYYKEKFSAEKSGEIDNTRKEIVQKYAEGLLWILQYYFSGVPSWTWFYPYHHGPFASDFKGLSGVQVKFQKGSPFKPFDQLMGVLSPNSAHALPEPYRKIMTDEESTIVDFYPKDFEIDMDGKRFMWQGIVKLPFINETRLLAETRKLEKDLGEEETLRNGKNENQLFVRSKTNLGLQILSFIRRQDSLNTCEIDTWLSDGISGIIRRFDEGLPTIDSTSPAEFQKDTVFCVFYEVPNCDPLIPRVLAGVEYPEKTISEADIMKTTLWHEYQQGRTTTRPNNQRWSSCKQSTFRGWAGRGKPLPSNSESVEGCSVAGSDQSLCRGVEHMRISEGRTQQANYCVWSSRNSSSYNMNHDRQANNASSFSQGRGRGVIPGSSQNTSNNSWQSGSRWDDPNASTQPRWRSENVRDQSSRWTPRGRSSQSSATERQSSRW